MNAVNKIRYVFFLFSLIFLVESGLLTEEEKHYFLSVNGRMSESAAVMAVHSMCDYLYRYYNKKVIILCCQKERILI